jgi:hypothetical protein
MERMLLTVEVYKGQVKENSGDSSRCILMPFMIERRELSQYG